MPYLFLLYAAAWLFMPSSVRLIPAATKNTTVISPVAVSTAKVKEALSFCRKNKLDTGYAFFADMSIHSGKKRFFIIDLHLEKMLASSLCCHGMGKASTCEKPVYSNESGSYCSSLGKYKTGGSGYFKWGIHIHYTLYGLDTTNNNALKRQVVLHSYEQVPETETYPEHLPMGWSLGCPVLSNNTMTTVDSLLKKRKKPVLLWMYE